MIIGAQLFTLRDYCRTLEDLTETLKRVADMGYTSVQLSAVCSYTGEEMAKILKTTGLTADLTHYDYNKVVSTTDDVIALHKAMGCRYIGLGYPPHPFTKEGFDTLAREIAPAVKKIASSGIKYMYHNHNKEFALTAPKSEGGEILLSYFLSKFSPDEVGVTLDAYWAQAGGADPIALIRRFKGRVDCVHLKDMAFSAEDNAPRMAVVGEGNMNYEGILEACLESGTKYAFVEQDNCYGEDPFACLKRSYEYLKQLLGSEMK